jgi:hypothetical protein
VRTVERLVLHREGFTRYRLTCLAVTKELLPAARLDIVECARHSDNGVIGALVEPLHGQQILCG